MIRTATINDFPRLTEMAGRFLASSKYGTWLPSTPAMLEALIAVVTEVGTILVAEINHGGLEVAPSQMVGMLALAAVPHPMNGELFAEEIAWWVEPEHRDSVVGPRLHAAGEAWAKGRGITLIRMLSPAGSDLGVYYRRHGYTEVETAWMKRL